MQSGFTTRMPSGSDLQSPESPSVRGRRDLPTSSSSSEEELDRGASTYRRSSRGWEIPHIPPSSVIPPPPMFNTRSYGRGREDWAAAYYGGLGGPMPINAYPGYPLAFDNIKMGESEIEKLAGLLKEHDKMKVENCNGDIDALLILVRSHCLDFSCERISIYVYASIYRLVFSPRLSQRSPSNPTRTCNLIQH